MNYNGDWFYLKSDGTMATNEYIASKSPASSAVYYVEVDGKYNSVHDSISKYHTASE